VQLELPLRLEGEERRPGSKSGMARWKADRAIDKIRDRFGWAAVGYGSVALGPPRSVLGPPRRYRAAATGARRKIGTACSPSHLAHVHTAATAGRDHRRSRIERSHRHLAWISDPMNMAVYSAVQREPAGIRTGLRGNATGLRSSRFQILDIKKSSSRDSPRDLRP
jgi:hypothetical protein